MRISDDRYSRDRLRLDLALRFIHHEARTHTIRAWTGLTDDRIRKLYRTYLYEAGGRGVFVCRREAEVDAAIAAWPAWPRLVQRFVPGDDRDVSVLARDGRVVAAAVQDRFLRHGLRFVDEPEALALAARLVEATGFSGLAHLDMRRRPDGGVEGRP